MDSLENGFAIVSTSTPDKGIEITVPNAAPAYVKDVNLVGSV